MSDMYRAGLQEGIRVGRRERHGDLALRFEEVLARNFDLNDLVVGWQTAAQVWEERARHAGWTDASEV